MHALREQLRAPADRARLVGGFTPQQVESVVAFNSPPALIDAELVQTKLLRDLYSERQLNEVMTDFWLNHFNVYIQKGGPEPYLIAEFENKLENGIDQCVAQCVSAHNDEQTQCMIGAKTADIVEECVK